MNEIDAIDTLGTEVAELNASLAEACMTKATLRADLAQRTAERDEAWLTNATLRADLARANAERDEAQKALASLQDKLLEFINDKEWLDRTFHEKVSIGRWDAASKIEDILIAFKKEVQNG